MPYILYKTNGNKFAVIDDASVDINTSLTFVGKNYSGYGQAVNENFLKLLENSANNTEPSKPIQGQLWFDTTKENQRLNVCYDGKNFKSFANIHIQSSTPLTSFRGDLWWDSKNSQLKTYDGSQYLVIGPINSNVSKSSWEHTIEYANTDPNYNYPLPIIKGKIGFDTVVIVSNEPTYESQSTSELYANFPNIARGITIAGANPITGVSSTGSGYGYIMWGSSAHALTANTATTSVVTEQTTGTFYLSFVNTTSGNLSIYTASGLSYDATTDILYATAISSQYADLAERYEADNNYEVGTLLVIGGPKEVTVTNERANIAVIGPVSTNPGFTMNSSAGSNDTHPYIALKGRVPCKVVGPISKGDLLVSSNLYGYACKYQAGDNALAVFAKALQDHNDSFGSIEVLIV